MFHHSSNKEVLSGQVKVEDIEPDVFQEILLFIYTGRTQLTAMNQMALGILAAAEWGQIPARRLVVKLIWFVKCQLRFAWNCCPSPAPMIFEEIDWLIEEIWNRVLSSFGCKFPRKITIKLLSIKKCFIIDCRRSLSYFLILSPLSCAQLNRPLQNSFNRLILHCTFFTREIWN